jgi:hypothetical protein
MIGVENVDGTITAIYCHWDGDIKTNGRLLAAHWTEPVKIAALMDLGNLSSLGPEIGEKHEPHPYRNDVCTTYARDWGRGDYEGDLEVWSRTYQDRKAFGDVKDNIGRRLGSIEFYYLHSKGEWLVRPCGKEEYEKLSDALAKLGIKALPPEEKHTEQQKIIVRFAGEDSWGRAVFKGDNDKFYKLADPCPEGFHNTTRSEQEELLQSLHSVSPSNDFDGEPDYPVAEELYTFDKAEPCQPDEQEDTAPRP